MSLVFQITSAGRVALVNAAHDGTNAVRIASCGLSGTAVVASADATALPGEFKRLASVSGAAVAADIIHVVVRDESGDAYTARSLALYLADGTLFGLYGQADPIINKAGGALGLLAVDITLADISATAITFGNANFLNPPATTATAGVVELADDTEAAALVDALRALTPRGLGQVFTAAKIIARLLTVDGAGSGLDADLLDGQEGAWYSNITARLGYTPLNAVSYTAGDVLGKLVTVDGAGSGLDADLLDGRDASAFALLTGAAFTGAVTTGGAGGGFFVTDRTNPASAWAMYHTAGTLRFNNGPDRMALDANGGLTVGSVNATTVRRGGVDVWGAENDGSGSGLDADLLDGSHAAAFARLSGADFGGPITIAGGSSDFGQLVIGNALGGATMALFSAQTLLRIGALTGNGAGAFINYGWTAGGQGPLIIAASGGEVARFQPNGVFNAGVGLTRGGNPVWDAANDGAGSGLDADLLDGWDRDAVRDWNNLLNKPESFPAAAFPFAASPNGSIHLPGGLIVQWTAGAADAPGFQGYQDVAFPEPFPTACLRAFPATRVDSSTQSGDAFYQLLGDPSQATARVLRQVTGNSFDGATTTPLIIAIGY